MTGPVPTDMINSKIAAFLTKYSILIYNIIEIKLYEVKFYNFEFV